MTRTGALTWGQVVRSGTSHHRQCRDRYFPSCAGVIVNKAQASCITLLGLWRKSLKMRFRATWPTPAFGQTQIALTEPVPLTFMDLGPPELNTVILDRGHAARP